MVGNHHFHPFETGTFGVPGAGPYEKKHKPFKRWISVPMDGRKVVNPQGKG